MYGHNGRHFGLAALQKCRFKDHRGEPGAPGPHAPIHNDHTRPPTPPSPDCRHQSPESTHETEPTEVTLDPRGSGLRFFMFIRPREPYTFSPLHGFRVPGFTFWQGRVSSWVSGFGIRLIFLFLDMAYLSAQIWHGIQVGFRISESAGYKSSERVT